MNIKKVFFLAVILICTLCGWQEAHAQTQLCTGTTTTFTGTPPGGTWLSSFPSVASVDISTGVVSALAAGTTDITYTPTVGAPTVTAVTVYPMPGAITGGNTVCRGSTLALANTAPGGSWASANTVTGTISPTGVFTGINAGTTTVSYTIGTCFATLVVTVHPLPSDIIGVSAICVGDATSLYADPGGTWQSTNPSIATVSALGTSGVVAGLSPGMVTIEYILPTGCMTTWPMTIWTTPSAITGPSIICTGVSGNLSSSPSGGTWSAPPSTAAFGSLHPVTGVVNGTSAGVIPVTYTLGTGCRVTSSVTVVTSPPAITGNPRVCEGRTSALTVPVPGTWASAAPGIAAIGSASGIMSGISAGITVITFTSSTGCINVLQVTVNAVPAVITGPAAICIGTTVTLASATAGGTWASDSTHIATITSGGGVLTPVMAGQARISYTLTATGCARWRMMTINALPGAITGPAAICSGSAGVYGTASAGGAWSSSNTAVAPLSGITTSSVTVVGGAAGTARITYQFPGSGCLRQTTVTVYPLPTFCMVAGGGNYCETGTGVPLGLSCSQAGVDYVLYHEDTAKGVWAGTGTSLSFGYTLMAGNYTIKATNTTTGCSRMMDGTATVTITPAVTPSVALVASADTVCREDEVTLTATATNGGPTPIYQWFVNGAITSGSGTTFSLSVNGLDTVLVRLIANESCMTTPIAVAEKHLATWAGFMPTVTAAFAPADTLCQGETINVAATYTNGGSLPLLYWLQNGSIIGGGATFSYVPADGDAINCMLVSNMHCRLKDTVVSNTLTARVMTPTPLTVKITPVITPIAGDMTRLVATTTPPTQWPQYQWTRNGSVVPGANAASFAFVLSDTEVIRCNIIDIAPCNNTGSGEWSFLSPPVVTGFNDRLSAFPNPNAGSFVITGLVGHLHDEKAPLHITNMIGKEVYRGVLEIKKGFAEGKIDFDPNLPNGAYILIIWLETGPYTFRITLSR